MFNQKEYQNFYDQLTYTQEQKAAIGERAAAAARKKPENKMLRLGKIAAAAACLVCVLTVTAEAAGISTPVSELLAPILGGSVAQTEVLDKIGHPIEASDTDNGVTIQADAVIGDEYNICMVFTISRDDGTPLLPEGVTADQLRAGLFGGIGFGKGGHGTAYFVDAVPGDAEIQYVWVFSSDEPVNRGKATAEFHDLCTYGNSEQESAVVLEGDWVFRVDVAYEDSSVVLGGGETFEQDDMTFTITEVRVSPLAVRVAYEVDSQVQLSSAKSGRMPEGDVRQIELHQGNVETHLNKKDNAIELYLENVEILLNKKDGTVVDMSNSGGSLAPENGKTVCVKGNAFEEIIPLEELESVSVGGITFPIPE